VLAVQAAAAPVQAIDVVPGPGEGGGGFGEPGRMTLDAVQVHDDVAPGGRAAPPRDVGEVFPAGGAERLWDAGRFDGIRFLRHAPVWTRRRKSASGFRFACAGVYPASNIRTAPAAVNPQGPLRTVRGRGTASSSAMPSGLSHGRRFSGAEG